MIEELPPKTEDQVLKDKWCRYFCSQVEFESGLENDSIMGQSTSSGQGPEEDFLTNICAEPESQRERGRSYALDARTRLESLKFGDNSLPSSFTADSELDTLDSEEEFRTGEESENEESALDSLDILDLKEEDQNDECWLYEPQRKPPGVERDSALRWCRQVLDNRSPEMEAACRMLMRNLKPRSRYQFCSHTRGSLEKTPFHTADSDFYSSGYKLQDITDVHVIARLQEASLRQDYISIPTAIGRNPEMPASHMSLAEEKTLGFVSGNKIKSSPPPCWPPSASRCQSPTAATREGCQSPRLSRLHQQVTQFKLLKRAQNQASPGITRSPLRTSLRSLQAVRKSRSLETEDGQAAGQNFNPVSDVSRLGPSTMSSSPSVSPIPLTPSWKQPPRATCSRVAAVKGLQRSQSLSPCRIPHPSRGHLSVHGRVFASPERPVSAAWGRRGHFHQRENLSIFISATSDSTSCVLVKATDYKPYIMAALSDHCLTNSPFNSSCYSSITYL